MRIPRIYQAGNFSSQQTIALDANAAHHLVNVLRLKPGAALILFNGIGDEFTAELITADKRLFGG